MFSIIISEKGGAERREHYGHPEITIGRVKGNDLMLPKGNVSKRHARLIVRDGRYIVTDLKSTNGTYVNHRRITHATLVREGDRIYIGDFVLRLEGPGHEDESSSGDEQAVPDSSTGSGRERRGTHSTASSPPMDPLRATHSGVPFGDQVSHFPIEHDPDESAPHLDVPAAPRVPTGFRAPSLSAATVGGTLEVATGEIMARSQPVASTVSVAAVSSDSQVSSRHSSSEPTGSFTQQQVEHQQALSELVQAVEQRLAPGLLDGVLDGAARGLVAAALDSCLTSVVDRGLPAGLEESVLRAAALAELTELGALGPFLEGGNLVRLRVMQRRVRVQQRGQSDSYAGLGFGSEASVGRAIARLCRRFSLSEGIDQPYLDAPLPGDKRLFVVTPQATGGQYLVVLEGQQERGANLEGLVRAGAISRGMASLLRHCVRARANIMIVGSNDQGKTDLATALASADGSRRAMWLADPEAPSETPNAVATLPLGQNDKSRTQAIEAACRVRPDLIMAPPLDSASTLALLDGIGRGAEGVVLRINAATLRKAIDRVAAELAAKRDGLDASTAREWLCACFDMAVEVTRLHDGRLRVVRIAELRSRSQGTTPTDIFTFAYHRVAAGGSVEGAFYANGTIPRIVEDYAARGMPLDVSIFRRHPTF